LLSICVSFNVYENNGKGNVSLRADVTELLEKFQLKEKKKKMVKKLFPEGQVTSSIKKLARAQSYKTFTSVIKQHNLKNLNSC
jgi:hypothetical protein